MTEVNSVNIVLLERCFHPLTGNFASYASLDEPLDHCQEVMIYTAIDRMATFMAPAVSMAVKAKWMPNGKGKKITTVGQAKELSRLIDKMWSQTPQSDRDKLSEWFRNFNNRADMVYRQPPEWDEDIKERSPEINPDSPWYVSDPSP